MLFHLVHHLKTFFLSLLALNTHKGGYFKYWNDDWKGKRAGRYDGAKECRHIVFTGNKVKR